MGGKRPLDRTASEAAVDRIAKTMELSRVEAAAGIYRMINLNMADGIRLMTLRRGVDPRKFALLSFGGAAGLHAAEVARELGEGKARSSRNALTHGLTAKVHLLQPGEDEPAFQGLATRLFAELAPTGEVDGFLVANLAAAMWRTGRAHQHESLACDGPGGPDERRLGLALRYHGSASRELFRSLRAPQELRRRPLAAQPAVENQPMAAAAPDAIPAVARLAWGGACPPAPPPGCLLMRPVAGRAPADWRWSQHHAFPGAEPVPVDAAGVAYALVDGAWLPQPASEPDLPAIRPPASPPPPPRAAEAPPEPRAPIRPRPAEPDPPAPPPDAPGPASDHFAALGPSRHDDPSDNPVPPLSEPCRDDNPQRRNEPRMPAPAPAGSGDAAAAADNPAAPIPPTDDPSRWYVMWGLTPPDVAPGRYGPTADRDPGRARRHPETAARSRPRRPKRPSPRLTAALPG